MTKISQCDYAKIVYFIQNVARFSNKSHDHLLSGLSINQDKEWMFVLHSLKNTLCH